MGEAGFILHSPWTTGGPPRGCRTQKPKPVSLPNQTPGPCVPPAGSLGGRSGAPRGGLLSCYQLYQVSSVSRAPQDRESDTDAHVFLQGFQGQETEGGGRRMGGGHQGRAWKCLNRGLQLKGVQDTQVKRTRGQTRFAYSIPRNILHLYQEAHGPLSLFFFLALLGQNSRDIFFCTQETGQ